MRARARVQERLIFVYVCMYDLEQYLRLTELSLSKSSDDKPTD